MQPEKYPQLPACQAKMSHTPPFVFFLNFTRSPLLEGRVAVKECVMSGHNY